MRIARALNKLWGRSGSVFADRYHDRIVRSPREVRNVICYVLHNSRRHGIDYEGPCQFASGWWFDGWREDPNLRVPEEIPMPVAAPRTWLLGVGWRKHGLLKLDESPRR